MKKRFDYHPIMGRVLAPKTSLSITIGKEQIKLSLIDYVDINMGTGEIMIRNRFTGGVMTFSPYGEVIRMNKNQLKLFNKNYGERFFETEGANSSERRSSTKLERVREG